MNFTTSFGTFGYLSDHQATTSSSTTLFTSSSSSSFISARASSRCMTGHPCLFQQRRAPLFGWMIWISVAVQLMVNPWSINSLIGKIGSTSSSVSNVLQCRFFLSTVLPWASSTVTGSESASSALVPRRKAWVAPPSTRAMKTPSVFITLAST